MKRFFTVTNFLDCAQTINLDYLIGFQQVKEGDETFVTLSMVHPTDSNTMYDVKVKEDYAEIHDRVLRANYM